MNNIQDDYRSAVAVLVIHFIVLFAYCLYCGFDCMKDPLEAKFKDLINIFEDSTRYIKLIYFITSLSGFLLNILIFILVFKYSVYKDDLKFLPNFFFFIFSCYTNEKIVEKFLKIKYPEYYL